MSRNDNDVATTEPMSTDSIFVYTTVADELSATDLGDLIVAEGLAACVQIVPGIRSIYRWKGEVKHDNEVRLVIKTTIARFEAIAALLREHHPYELPEIVAVPVVLGSKGYLAWIASSTAGEAGAWGLQ